MVHEFSAEIREREGFSPPRNGRKPLPIGTRAQEAANGSQPARALSREMKRCYSLKRNKEFRRVYKNGKSVGSHTLVLIYSSGRQPERKIGFAVGKRIGNAVVRNRVKRRLREAVTPLLPEIVPGSRLIFIARGAITDASFKEIETTVRHLVSKAGLLG